MMVRNQYNTVQLLNAESGSSLVETAVVMPLLLLMLAIAVDLGRAFTAAITTTSAANAGAMYGAQHPTDTAGMVAAAAQDAGTLFPVQAVAQFGCECSDGSSAVASCASEPGCTYNSVYYMQLNTTTTYTPLLPYPGLTSGITLHGKVRVRASR